MTDSEGTEMKRLCDVVDEATFRELLDRCQAVAAEQGGFFIFDEAFLVMGERAHAGYLRRLARSVGMNELAARLNPELFAPGAFEKLQDGMCSIRLGRQGPEDLAQVLDLDSARQRRDDEGKGI